MKPITALTDYFYGDEAEQFTYFRIPRLLITSPRFKGLSTEAKLLYGMMLDRMGLSTKNGWYEEDGRVFIYYTVDEICADMNCCRVKAVNLLAELDDNKGIGLLSKKRQGQGKPTKIYVKRFTTREVPSMPASGPSAASSGQDLQAETAQKFEKQTSRSTENVLQEVNEANFKKYKKCTSESIKTVLPEVQKSDVSYNNINNPDIIYPESVNPSIQPSTESPAPARVEPADGLTDGRAVRERIKKQIDYDFLPYRLNGWELKQADEMLELMVEVAMNRSQTMRVGRDEFVTSYVQERFKAITIDHIEQVLQGLKENEGRITNVKAYLLASLFNAAATSYNTASLSAASGS